MSRRIVVIGGGPAGYTAALRASQLGAEVSLVEKGQLGGTCLNVGCIPTKSLLESSGIWAKGASLFPLQAAGVVPWETIVSRKNQAVKQLRAGIEGLLRAGKIEVVHGTAAVTGDKQVVVRGEMEKSLTADTIIIATGSRPILPPLQGIDTPGVMTSDEILSLRDLPKRLAIIGGGVIGVEFATIFSELGVDVVVIEAAERILPNMDTAISRGLQEHLKRQGVSFQLGKKVERIAKGANYPCELLLSDGEQMEADLVLIAVGREAVLESLGAEEAGIVIERKKIRVNEYQHTTRQGIYAAGDCSSPMMLAHVAMAEGKVAVEHAMGLSPEPVPYELVPQCVYSHPEAAAVGLTAEEAKHRGFDAQEGVFPLSASGKALVGGETTGFIKVVSEQKYGRILGVHLLAPHATEMIAEAVLALTMEATADELLKTIHPHPTIAEGIQDALLSLNGLAIHLLHQK